jgi:hypothetical protein
MQILGEPIYLGSFQYRRDAIAAEQTALTIRKALERAQSVKRLKSKQISFTINDNQSEQAA